MPGYQDIMNKFLLIFNNIHSSVNHAISKEWRIIIEMHIISAYLAGQFFKYKLRSYSFIAAVVISLVSAAKLKNS